eukprot:gb/GECG01012306.1/.p1 GENE.gb/GECG01012306.1/~~gb/GECG01012306.1/.p1  ORF type:complete len:148 (+),score=6.92 gb/GECG01012306.1/:1-444(+)
MCRLPNQAWWCYTKCNTDGVTPWSMVVVRVHSSATCNLETFNGSTAETFQASHQHMIVCNLALLHRVGNQTLAASRRCAMRPHFYDELPFLLQSNHSHRNGKPRCFGGHSKLNELESSSPAEADYGNSHYPEPRTLFDRDKAHSLQI